MEASPSIRPTHIVSTATSMASAAKADDGPDLPAPARPLVTLQRNRVLCLAAQPLSAMDNTNSSPLPTSTSGKSRGGSDLIATSSVLGGTRTASPLTTPL